MQKGNFLSVVPNPCKGSGEAIHQTLFYLNMIENEKPVSPESIDGSRPAAIGPDGQANTVEQASASVVAAIAGADEGARPAGKRGRHKKDCTCAKCTERKGPSESNPFDTNFPTETNSVSQV